MKSILYTLGFSLFANFIVAQVPKKIVVEHFTNSRCSVCANRNPGFFNNLVQHPEVLHISMYPSSPYPNCYFSQQNATENDGRTNYYNVYGSTPVFVIQGQVISQAANYASASLFSPFVGQTSPVSIRVDQIQNTDSIITTVSIKTEAVHALGSLSLFGAITEDTVFYASPNGETEQYNLHRKSLFGNSGMSISIPNTVGDSVTFRKSITNNLNWNQTRLKSLVVIQESATKSVIQAAESYANGEIPAGLMIQSNMNIQVFPNPTESILTIRIAGEYEQAFYLFNSLGEIQRSGTIIKETQLDFSHLPHGIYLLKIGNTTHKIIH
jgi:hypothetical protein